MTITTITRTGADPIPTEADFNVVLETTPCDELAELQEQYDAAAAMDPPPKGVAGLASRIRAKQRECDAYNAAPTPVSKPAPEPTQAEKEATRKATDTQQKQEQDENRAARGEYLQWKNGGND